MLHRFITIWNKTNLIKRISIGIGIGVLLAIIFPQAQDIGLLSQIFVAVIIDPQSSGIAGNMIIGALVDLGADANKYGN